MKKIIITTGGTGGHIFPAEAIAKGLLEAKYQVIFITDKRGASFRKLTQIPTKIISATSVTGRGLLGKIGALFVLWRGLVQSCLYLMQEKPDMVIGVGGYASLPAVLAAQFLRIPTMVHEQNAVLGRANRLLAPRVKMIATAFRDTKQVPPGISTFWVGQPVRDKVLEKYHTPYRVENPFHLLITGGSQGARFLSRMVPEALLQLPDEIKANLQITQQARAEDVDELQKKYQNVGFYATTVQPFFEDIPTLLAHAHLVICRSGSSTLAELAIVGRPGIFIPLPTSADNHQFENARQFMEAGAGWLVAEKDFDAEKLTTRLMALIQNKVELEMAAQACLKLAHPDVAQKMVALVDSVLKGKK